MTTERRFTLDEYGIGKLIDDGIEELVDVVIERGIDAGVGAEENGDRVDSRP